MTSASGDKDALGIVGVVIALVFVLVPSLVYALQTGRWGMLVVGACAFLIHVVVHSILHDPFTAEMGRRFAQWRFNRIGDRVMGKRKHR